MCLCLCVLSLLVCCFLSSEVNFLDMLEDELPQNRMCWKYAPSNKYAACVELDIRPNSLRSLIMR